MIDLYHIYKTKRTTQITLSLSLPRSVIIGVSNKVAVLAEADRREIAKREKDPTHLHLRDRILARENRIPGDHMRSH